MQGQIRCVALYILNDLLVVRPKGLVFVFIIKFNKILNGK